MKEKKNRFRFRIHELREAHGYKSQQSFAKDFDVAQSTVGGWESGSREPDFDMVIRLSEFFGTTTDDIIVGNSPTESIYFPSWQWDGRRLREERETRGRSANDLVEFLGMPITEYNAYESGAKCPPVSVLAEIAIYLCTSMDALAGLEFTPSSELQKLPNSEILTNLFRQLNPEGQKKLIGYLGDLMKNEDNLLPSAPTAKSGA